MNMKMLMSSILTIGIFASVFGQTQDTYIRKIAKDFFVSKEMLSEKMELNSISLIVYDFVNKKDITNDEVLPKQKKLIFYNFRVLSPHSLGYVLLVKNGVHEIIDMSKKLLDI